MISRAINHMFDSHYHLSNSSLIALETMQLVVQIRWITTDESENIFVVTNRSVNSSF